MEEQTQVECAAPLAVKSVGKLAKALAKAQKNFKTVNKSKVAKVKGKTATGNEYSYEYKYADLADILQMALPALSAEGIAFSQPLRRKDGKLYVITRLEFEDEVKEDDGLAVPEQVKPAELGSYLTFYRRYGVSTNLGISTEEDTDAPEEKVVVSPNKQSTSELPKKEPRKVTKKEDSIGDLGCGCGPNVRCAKHTGQSSGFQATDEDVPNNISSIPDAGQRKDYIARLKELIAKSDKDSVQKFIATVVGGEFTTNTLTKAQWDESLGKMETAEKAGKLKELVT